MNHSCEMFPTEEKASRHGKPETLNIKLEVMSMNRGSSTAHHCT